MATKTSSKTATRKAAPSAAGRKTTAPEKPADVAPKGKLPKKGSAAPAEASRIRAKQQEPTRTRHPAPGDCLADRSETAGKKISGQRDKNKAHRFTADLTYPRIA